MFYKKHKAYKFGSLFDLSQITLDRLILIFNTKNYKKPDTILTGRYDPVKTTIEKIGPVVIKHYTRGGLISYFNRDKYLFSKKSRGEMELNTLTSAIQAGVNVPQPVGYASRGSIFYQAWLITKEIENSKNFVEICLNEKDRALSLLPAICEDINKLIKISMHHVDLHPGNIVVDEFDKPFILDFDKACYFSGDKRTLAKKYKQRWQRAINKYKLPSKLSDLKLL
jgi:hypothetical protein